MTTMPFNPNPKKIYCVARDAEGISLNAGQLQVLKDGPEEDASTVCFTEKTEAISWLYNRQVSYEEMAFLYWIEIDPQTGNLIDPGVGKREWLTETKATLQ